MPQNASHPVIIRSDDKIQTVIAWIQYPADATLIAAAPEMLAALIELCADKYLSDPINSDRMKNARAAIQKAQGEA